MQVENGWMSPHFATDKDRLECVIEDPHILITDLKLDNVQAMVPLLEKLVKVTKNLVIFCDEMQDEILSTLVLNKMKGNLKPLVVRAPSFGERRKNMCEDMAALTGGMFINPEIGYTLEGIEVAALGRASKVISNSQTTTIIGGKGTDDQVYQRIQELRKQLELDDSPFEGDIIKQRLAKLSGGVGVIKVGGATEVEVKERKDRVEDALNATRAAVEEGVVVGGEIYFCFTSLAFLTRALPNSSNNIDSSIGQKPKPPDCSEKGIDNHPCSAKRFQTFGSKSSVDLTIFSRLITNSHTLSQSIVGAFVGLTATYIQLSLLFI